MSDKCEQERNSEVRIRLDRLYRACVITYSRDTEEERAQDKHSSKDRLQQNRTEQFLGKHRHQKYTCIWLNLKLYI